MQQNEKTRNNHVYKTIHFCCTNINALNLTALNENENYLCCLDWWYIHISTTMKNTLWHVLLLFQFAISFFYILPYAFAVGNRHPKCCPLDDYTTITIKKVMKIINSKTIITNKTTTTGMNTLSRDQTIGEENFVWICMS